MQENRSLAQLINNLTVLERLIQTNMPITKDYAKTIYEAKQLVIAWELIGIATDAGTITSP